MAQWCFQSKTRRGYSKRRMEYPGQHLIRYSTPWSPAYTVGTECRRGFGLWRGLEIRLHSSPILRIRMSEAGGYDNAKKFAYDLVTRDGWIGCSISYFRSWSLGGEYI